MTDETEGTTMTDKPQTQLDEVTQADRDAARPLWAKWWRNMKPNKIAKLVDTGWLDDHPLLQALARHRIEALRTPDTSTKAPADVVEAVPFETENADGWTDWIHPEPGYLLECCNCAIVHELQFGIGPTDAASDRLNAGETAEKAVEFRASHRGFSTRRALPALPPKGDEKI